MLETALEMVDAVLDTQNKECIIGVYDAPVRVKQQNDPSISSMAEQIACQIKNVKGAHDAVGLSIRMLDVEDEEGSDPTTELEGFAVGGFGGQLKKIEVTQETEMEEIVAKVVTARNYARIVDFDDHFNDISLDWRNKDFSV